MCVCVCTCVGYLPTCTCSRDLQDQDTRSLCEKHIANRSTAFCVQHLYYPFFNQSAPSARSGLNLDQPASLLRTVLLVHQHESHRRLTSFSHCIRLQRNVIMELGPNNTTSALYMCCSWVCTAAVSSKHDWENRLFILSWSEEATVALVVKNDCRK